MRILVRPHLDSHTEEVRACVIGMCGGARAVHSAIPVPRGPNELREPACSHFPGFRGSYVPATVISTDRQTEALSDSKFSEVLEGTLGPEKAREGPN